MTSSVLGDRGASGSGRSTRRRHVSLQACLPPLLAIAFLALAHFLFGASSPVSALFVSACLIGAALLTVLLAGPRHVTFGMLIGAGAIWAFAVTGAAGRLDRALPTLAVLFAAGAVWTVGYVCARRRGVLDIAWAGLVWSSLVYCVWTFFRHIADALASAQGIAAPGPDFETAPTAALLFGLFALIAAARVLHVVKQMDAQSLSRAMMIDRLFRDGLGGLLLLGFSATCLILTGSRVGMLFAAAVLLFQAWWDTRAITGRDHRSRWVRVLAQATPLAAAAIAAWGVGLAYMRDETVIGAVASQDILPRLQRLQVYFAAWLEQPFLGHGLGSIAQVRDHAMTLANAEALGAPGGAQNVVLHVLVEAGAAGLVVLALALGAVHAGLLRAIGAVKAPRTFLRLAFAASLLMVLHGVADSSLDLPSAIWLYAFLLGAACGVAVFRRPSTESRAL